VQGFAETCGGFLAGWLAYAVLVEGLEGSCYAAPGPSQVVESVSACLAEPRSVLEGLSCACLLMSGVNACFMHKVGAACELCSACMESVASGVSYLRFVRKGKEGQCWKRSGGASSRVLILL
jgi:hypothetical protein